MSGRVVGSIGLAADPVGSHHGGWYYPLTAIGRGGQPVTVKLSKHGRHVCLSCGTADACEHAAWVAAYITDHGLPEEVRS